MSVSYYTHVGAFLKVWLSDIEISADVLGCPKCNIETLRMKFCPECGIKTDLITIKRRMTLDFYDIDGLVDYNYNFVTRENFRGEDKKYDIIMCNLMKHDCHVDIDDDLGIFDMPEDHCTSLDELCSLLDKQNIRYEKCSGVVRYWT